MSYWPIIMLIEGHPIGQRESILQLSPIWILYDQCHGQLVVSYITEGLPAESHQFSVKLHLSRIQLTTNHANRKFRNHSSNRIVISRRAVCEVENMISLDTAVIDIGFVDLC